MNLAFERELDLYAYINLTASASHGWRITHLDHCNPVIYIYLNRISDKSN